MCSSWASSTLEQLCGSLPRAPLRGQHTHHQLLEYWLPMAQSSGNCLCLRSQTLSGDGPPPMTGGAGIQRVQPHRLSLGQPWRVIPGPGLFMELAKGSVVASPYASFCHPYFLTDVSLNHSLKLTFWMQFSVSESDSREPHQRKLNMWLIPHILKMKG